MHTQDWGAVMYAVAALGSVAMALVLTFSSASAPQLFPQAGYEELLRAFQMILPVRPPHY
jgi:hypothetical protein